MTGLGVLTISIFKSIIKLHDKAYLVRMDYFEKTYNINRKQFLQMYNLFNVLVYLTLMDELLSEKTLGIV